MAAGKNRLVDEAYKLYKDGMKLVNIAKQLKVPDGTVRRWKNTYHWDGECSNEKANVWKESERSDKNERPEKKRTEEYTTGDGTKETLQNNGLTPEEQMFCLYYIRSFNATQSYMKAYNCTYKTAHSKGYSLVAKVGIKREIDRLKELKRQQILYDIDDLVELNMRIAFADISDYLTFGEEEVQVMSAFGPVTKKDDSGQEVPVMKVVNTVKLKDSCNLDTQLIQEVKNGKNGVSIKLADRNKAMDWLVRFFKTSPANRYKDEFDRIMSLEEIQKLRTRIAMGEEKDASGLNAGITDRIKAMSDLEKTLAEKEKDEIRQKEKAEREQKQPYTIPIMDITSDFVEVYRKIHAAFEGEENIREIISKGGRGSAKSNFWAAVAEETIYNDPQAHVVYTRRYKVDLRGSVYNQFMKTVIRHGKLDEWEFKTNPMMAVYKKTGQCVIFVGADKPISLKSYNLSFGYVKLLIHEECDEMAGLEQMDNIEDTFLRSDTPALDVKVFNPPKSKNNFMNAYVEECRNKEGTYICHSYYYNVPVKWLGKRFFERAEYFRVNKPLYYRNNYLGEVTGTGGGIFENIEARAISDEEIRNMPYFSHGLDFGYEHPQVFIKSYYDSDRDILYCVDEVYSKKCKNSTFARKIKQYRTVEILADSARPDSIAEMADWGFQVTGAVKRWGSGKGRDYCWEWLQMTTKIVVDPDRCPHLHHELTTLEHEQLKDGTFSSEYPKLGEDCVMALIYANNRNIMESRRNSGLYEDDDEQENDEE